MVIQSRAIVPALVALAAAAGPVDRNLAAIMTSGSILPSPLHAGDGIVTSDLQVGFTVSSTGSVSVTDGDTLTTRNRSFIGSGVGATGEVDITGATWDAESAVFIARNFLSEGTVTVTDGTWTVESNLDIAQGDQSVGEVILNSGSWTVEFGVDIADCEDCQGTVTLNGGTWTAKTGVVVGGLGFTDSNGDGSINIGTGALMDSRYGLHITDLGSLQLDGGTLSLAGESSFDGVVDATPSGGTMRLNVGPVAGGIGLLNVSDDVDLSGIEIEIAFHPDFTPDPAETFDLFEAHGLLELSAILDAASLITPPAQWQLDHGTGVLSLIPEPATATLLLTGLSAATRRRPPSRSVVRKAPVSRRAPRRAAWPLPSTGRGAPRRP
ncbi:MAG: hypothetical protein CMJ18_00130 [Phycisphaeraceae bacterium]|nr:hypothetical protein [Phycisphaeraceae bacterium]